MNAERYLRSFHVLSLLVGRDDGLRLTEIKDALDLPVSSVHNMLQTMVAAGVLNVTPDLRYTVGPRMVSIALSTVNSLDIRSLARRHLQALTQEIDDDVYLGIRLGNRVLYADRCVGTQRLSLDIRLGDSLDLHNTATGKLFCAFDPQLAAHAMAGPLVRQTPHTITEPARLSSEFDAIRARGYATSHEEAVEGIVGFALPVRQGNGDLAAAIHVSVLAARVTAAHESKLIAAARSCTAQLEKVLAASSAPASHHASTAGAGQSFHTAKETS